MPNHKVEYNQTDHNGYRCVVVMTRMGHRCGYVGITPMHRLHGAPDKHPSKTSTGICKVNPSDPVGTILEIGKTHASIGYAAGVHGGITYAKGGADYPIESDENLWWFGFDCDHAEDRQNPKSLEFCIKQCQILSDFLKSEEAQSTVELC